MLTFLRTIRRSFIESLPAGKVGGSARKYLLYAIGEIALVAIGILIALQFNNWNEWKKDRVKETEILQSLKDNFELNIETLESDIDNLTHLNKSARIAVSVLDNRLPYVDSIGVHFHLARIPKDQLSISRSGYEQYKNIGYDIILDDKLKQEVVNYFESTFPKWQMRYNQVNYKNESFFDYHLPLFSYKTLSLEPIDIKALYTDQYFTGWLKAYMGGRTSLIQMEHNLIGETLRVLQLIKDELGETE